jgi:hypothetical protein
MPTNFKIIKASAIYGHKKRGLILVLFFILFVSLSYNLKASFTLGT